MIFGLFLIVLLSARMDQYPKKKQTWNETNWTLNGRENRSVLSLQHKMWLCLMYRLFFFFKCLSWVCVCVCLVWIQRAFLCWHFPANKCFDMHAHTHSQHGLCIVVSAYLIVCGTQTHEFLLGMHSTNELWWNLSLGFKCCDIVPCAVRVNSVLFSAGI